MQEFAEILSYGGGLAYVVLLLGLLAFPVSIAALIIALVSKKRRLGMIFGLVSIGLAAVAFLAGAVGYLMGMGEAEVALAGGFVDPASRLPMAARAIGMALPVMGLGALLGGLPFVLGVLALCRAAVRPAAADPAGGKGAAVVSAILPGASVVASVVLLILMQDGPEGLARMISESGGFGLMQVLFYVLAVVAISILAPKAARGRRVLVAPLLLLAALPWLVGFSSIVFAGADALTAIDAAAPDARAAVLARGIAMSINSQVLGTVTSAWLLLAVGLGMALGARGQRAEGRSGKGWLFGALAGIPLLALAGIAMAGAGGTAMLVAIGAAMGLVIAMLGCSGMGDDGPHHRSVSLGVGAALAAGLACAALCFAAAATVSVMVFSALESASPEQRTQLLVGAAQSATPMFVARDWGWLLALLPAGVVALIGLRRTGPSAGRIAGAALAGLIFVLAPMLNLVALSSLELPTWARPHSPWEANPGFLPPVVTRIGCELGGGSSEPHACIGMRQVTIQGRPAGDLADPNVQGQLSGWFAGALNQQGMQADPLSRGPSKVLNLAVDDRLTAPYLALILRAAEAAGATSVGLVGVEVPSDPVDPRPAADLHPLLVIFGYAASGRVCALKIDLGSPPVGGPEAVSVWHGVISGEDEIDLALLTGPPGDGSAAQERLRVPRRTMSDLYDLGRDEWSPGEAPRGYVVLTADQSVTAGRMILAAAAARARGLVPSFPDPQIVSRLRGAR